MLFSFFVVCSRFFFFFIRLLFIFRLFFSSRALSARYIRAYIGLSVAHHFIYYYFSVYQKRTKFDISVTQNVPKRRSHNWPRSRRGVSRQLPSTESEERAYLVCLFIFNSILLLHRAIARCQMDAQSLCVLIVCVDVLNSFSAYE